MAQPNKDKQLGMPHGTARAKLNKSLLFELAKKCSLDICFQCKEKITEISTFSIEHKTPWMHSEEPVKLYFDLDNIAFSHLRCNIKEARNPLKGTGKHPSAEAYKKGCRCSECKDIARLRIANQRARRKALTGKDR